MNIRSVLASAFSSSSSILDASGAGSTPSVVSSSASSSSIDFSSMTIAQIRQLTDQMGKEGKLTGLQQIFLIGAGLQDMNANDPSVQYLDPSNPSQPLPGAGYSILDTATYNLNDLLSGYTQFYSSISDTREAEIIASTEQSIKAYETDPASGASATSVNATA